MIWMDCTGAKWDKKQFESVWRTPLKMSLAQLIGIHGPWTTVQMHFILFSDVPGDLVASAWII